ncbi:hypothetical protein BGX27_003750 [Mortierella sp. AM989]|nr:hypothetical protein BGX27_003750 [Mortierella sp. AM989]
MAYTPPIVHHEQQQEEQLSPNPNTVNNDASISTTTAEASASNSPISSSQKNNTSFAVESMQDMNNTDANDPTPLTSVIPTNAEGFSIYSNIKDGKVSVEHQIEINVIDLFDVQGSNEISLEEIMDSLRYVMEYRIKGGRFTSLDYNVMKRLADGLLQNMGAVEKKRKFRQSLTEVANVAFQLFGEFLLEGKWFAPEAT